MLLHKRFFNTKMSQAKVADNFIVHPKKLHLTVSRRKYDPGKKLTKCKISETPKTTPKKAKKNPQDQPQDQQKGTTEENQPTMSTQDDPVDVNSDEDLPDLFGAFRRSNFHHPSLRITVSFSCKSNSGTTPISVSTIVTCFKLHKCRP